jgi:amidohydrolase
MPIDWMARAQALREQMVARRRDLHQHPELGFEEVRTAGIVARELGELGLEVSSGVGKTGVVGILDGERDGPTVMVRCDMDALPITEANTVDYASQTPGKMHACGHDGHTAMALGVAQMLSEQRGKLAGKVKFVFQPAEEIAQGAQAMIADGVLDSPTPEVCIGLHLWNYLPIGEVALAKGPIMAGADDWTITVRGYGGHGALPDQARDPLIAGVQIINALQTIISRNVGGLDTAILSTTTFHAGTTHNVIPAEATFGGTFRTYQPPIHDMVERRLREIATGIAAAMQCEAQVVTHQLTPPVVNDAAVVDRLRHAFSQINGPRPLTWNDTERSMVAEDVSLFLNKVPGVFLLVGSANPARQLNFPHHHPRFDFDEDVLPIGAGLLATAIADYVLAD